MGSGAVPAAMGASASEPDIEWFVLVANIVADAAGEVIRKYFRKSFEIVDKDDLSMWFFFFLVFLFFGTSVVFLWVWLIGLMGCFAGPVTIADRAAEESMVSIILKHFPSHAMSVVFYPIIMIVRLFHLFCRFRFVDCIAKHYVFMDANANK